MSVRVVSTEEVQKIATLACESYIRALEDEGVLKHSSESILTQYSILVYEKGWFSKFVDSFFKTGDGLNFRTVKHIIHAKNDNNSGPKDTREAQVLSILDRAKSKKQD